jgi:ADP-ribose pyrophosphatase YjhB (NUDIX family)
MKKTPSTPKVKLGPGEYRPDIAFTKLEDLPKAKVIKQRRNYEHRPCPHCGKSAFRDKVFTRQLHDVGDLLSGRPHELHIIYSQHYCSACDKYFNADLSDVDALRALFAGETGHATPKVDVRGVVFRDDAILLVRERSEGRWTLPGGWADIGESAGEAVVRETREESGYRTRAVKLLALYDRNKHPHPPYPFHAYKLIFQCKLLGGEPVTSFETDGIDFFRENELPELSTTRVTAARSRGSLNIAATPNGRPISIEDRWIAAIRITP